LTCATNPGGLLDQGVAGFGLVPRSRQGDCGDARARAGLVARFDDKNPQQWPRLPIVVIVNVARRALPEIISGALQDHDRAVLVGTPTFGKGLVQSFWRLTPETG